MISNEEMLSWVKKNPITVGCALVSIALLVTTYLRMEKIPEAEALLAEKTAQADRHETNIKYSAQLKEQLDALVAANKEIDSRLVRAAQLGANSQFFFRLPAETGVKLISANQMPVGKPTGKATFIPVPFSVVVEGDLQQILQLLHFLESGARYCRIVSASCSTPSATVVRTGHLQLSLNLELLGLP